MYSLNLSMSLRREFGIWKKSLFGHCSIKGTAQIVGVWRAPAVRVPSSADAEIVPSRPDISAVSLSRRRGPFLRGSLFQLRRRFAFCALCVAPRCVRKACVRPRRIHQFRPFSASSCEFFLHSQIPDRLHSPARNGASSTTVEKLPLSRFWRDSICFERKSGALPLRSAGFLCLAVDSKRGL